MGSRARLLFSMVLLGAGAGVAGCGVEAPRPPIPPRLVNDTDLRTARAGEWLAHGRDWTNQRFVPLSEINRETVTRLRTIWRSLRPYERQERTQSTPVVVEDLLIYTGDKNVVIALDVRTGRERWRYEPTVGPAALCCGLVNRGLAVYGDRVYLATLDARVIALRRRDGSVAWDVRAADPAQGYSFTMAPLAADGKIIVGASGGEFSIRGFVDAYDPATGRLVWRFWTVPSPEDGGWYGRWSPTAPHGEPLPRDIAAEKRDSARFAEAWRKGGAGVWSTPAYDPELGLLVVATGNPTKASGRTPPGDNLYSNSVLALHVGTGKLAWYYQTVPHDIWDYDPSSPPVLFDLTVGDSTIPAAGQASKTGWVYIVDRRTGRPLRRSDAFIPLENPFPTPTRAGVRTSPAKSGGGNWPPSAYSPRTGLFYVLGNYIPMLFVLDSVADSTRGGTAPAEGHFKKLPDSLQAGTVSAIDVSTGKIRWQQKVPFALRNSGLLATAGGLVFYGNSTGWLTALDADTGAELWREHVGRRFVGPPISFEVDGRQRLAVVSRWGVTLLGLP